MTDTHFSERSLWTWFALAVVLACAPVAARAEGFVDVYVGAGLPQDSDVETSADDPDTDLDLASAYSAEIEWETTPSFGVRGGYWFEGWGGLSFLGLGLDLSSYWAVEDASVGEIAVWAAPLTPLLMLRIPLGYSEQYPGGRVQPYAAIGPGFTLAAAQVETEELTPPVGSPNIAFEEFEAAGFGVGFDARAGLAIPIGPHFALFGEYRYTWVEPKFEDDIEVLTDPGPFVFETEVEFEPELETHHILFGASYRF